MTGGRVTAPDAWRPGAVILLSIVGLAMVALMAAIEVGPRLASWAGAGVFVLALAGVAMILAARPLPAVARTALGAWLALVAWSFASVAWAQDAASAWEGSARTAVLGAMLVLGLCAVRSGRRRAISAVIAAWVAIAGVGALVIVVAMLGSHVPQEWFLVDRLVKPVGYANGQAAFLALSGWLALGLAASTTAPWMARAGAAGTTVLCAGLMLLTLSRGAVFTLPVAACVFAVVAPGRRSAAAAGVCAAAVLLAAPALLDVGPALRAGSGEGAAIDRALFWLPGVSILAALVVAFGARRAPGGPRGLPAPRIGNIGRRFRLVGGAVVTAGAVAAVMVGPTDLLDRVAGGYGDRGASQSRFLDGGSNRGDFFAAAVKMARGAPVHGVGADNFGVAYLPLATVRETPRYTHSWPLAIVAQLGVIGALLAAVWLGALMWAGVAGLRDGTHDPVLVAALMAGAGGFLAHGTIDWLWEFPVAGWAGFFVLGMMLGLAPAEPATGATGDGGRASAPVPVRAVVAVAVFIPGASAALLLPASAARETTDAARTWVADPARAYAQLDHAARRDPLSARPYLTAGTIAVQRGTLQVADRYFAAALARHRSSTLALILRAAIASRLGDERSAAAWAAHARRRHPSNAVVAAAEAALRRGETLDPLVVVGQIGAFSRAIGSG